MPSKFSSNRKSGLSNTIKIGVLCGGRSSERAVSLRSGDAVYRALKRLGYSCLKIDPADPPRMNRRLKKIAVAFIALHGTGGEDGYIQKLLSRKKIRFTGSDAISSSTAFDKNLSKQCFVRHGIPTPPGMVLKNQKIVPPAFPGPYFAKPVQNGSSVGVFSIEDFDKNVVNLKKKIRQHGSYLIEKKIQGREFTVGILGSKVLPVIELKPKRDFYDYKSKYTKGMTDYLVPAPITTQLASKLQRISMKVHRVLKLRHMSRVDLLVDENGRPYVLEANTIPGMTNLSLLPKAAGAAGISFEQMCEKIVLMALEN